FKIKRFDDVLSKTNTVTVGYTLKGVTTFVDNSIKPDSTYIYFISAENEHGRTFSEEIQVTITTHAPAEPSNVSTDTSNCYQVEIRWNDNADNEAKYLVIRKKNGIENDSVVTTVNANVNNYVDNTIMPAVAYSYKIGVANHIDTIYTNWKEAINTSCASAPKQPGNLKAESVFCILDSITRMEFTWIDSSFNETQFELQIQMDGDNWESHHIGRDTTSFVLTLDYDTNYTARLRALNSIDTSSWTTVLDFETSCECNRGTYGNFGELWQVGDTIQAEYFDYCQSGLYGQNITYYEPTPESWAGDNTIRPNDKIDLFRNPTAAGDTIIRIGATGQGEYVEYSIQIKQKDTLFIVSRVANKGDNDVTINYYLDEELVTTLTYAGRTNWKDYHIEFSDFFAPEPG
ncbi:MAG: hypothetical protein MI922_17935, partial [Bacteroidales bacterium]|nr:hypothetical protein [Bacteroidales bacterium]